MRRESYNYFSQVLDARASTLVLEIFSDGKLTDTTFGERMEPMFCEMLATLLNRRLIRKGRHVSIYFLASEKKAIAQQENRNRNTTKKEGIA